MKKIFFFRFFIITALLVILIITIYFTIATIDWLMHRKQLLTNLQNYYELIKTKNLLGNKFVQIDQNGKIIKTSPTRIYDKNNEIIGQFYQGKREIISEDEIPDILFRTVVLIEDRRFYKHFGIDFKGILRAAYYNIKNFRIVMGGSTLTQQLAKVFFTSRKRNFYRKFFELWGALEIENRFSKKDILLLYLNNIYFGHGSYGIGTASKLYFSKHVSRINYKEAALLTGMITRPNYYSPIKYPDRAKTKQAVVLNKMKEAGIIPNINVKKTIKTFWVNYNKRLRMPGVSFWKMTINKAPYVTEYIRQQLLKHYSTDEILSDGIIIKSSIDMQKQKIARRIVTKYIRILKMKNRSIECALIALNPKTGEIEAFVGGSGFTFNNQLNRAFFIKRPVGSTIKPFIYAAGIEHSIFNSATLIKDEPVRYGKWTPQNYNKKYEGLVTVREALQKSINTVAVKALKKIRVQTLVNQFENINSFKASKRDLTLALGNIDFSPIDLAGMYSIFPSGGIYKKPYLIKTINNTGKNIITENVNGEEIRVFSKETSFIMNKILQRVILWGGTGYNAAQSVNLRLKASAKSGTTDGNQDAWFAAYTPYLVTVVWVGYDKNLKSNLKLSGGQNAGPICLDFINTALWNIPDKDYDIPNNVVKLDICLDSGLKANNNCDNISYNHFFTKETEPKHFCTLH